MERVELGFPGVAVPRPLTRPSSGAGPVVHVSAGGEGRDLPAPWVAELDRGDIADRVEDFTLSDGDNATRHFERDHDLDHKTRKALGGGTHRALLLITLGIDAYNCHRVQLDFSPGQTTTAPSMRCLRPSTRSRSSATSSGCLPQPRTHERPSARRFSSGSTLRERASRTSASASCADRTAPGGGSAGAVPCVGWLIPAGRSGYPSS